jgi:hypothetical protein
MSARDSLTQQHRNDDIKIDFYLCKLSLTCGNAGGQASAGARSARAFDPLTPSTVNRSH